MQAQRRQRQEEEAAGVEAAAAEAEDKVAAVIEVDDKDPTERTLHQRSKVIPMG